MIVLLIFLLICSGLGIAAFTMSLRGCNKDGFMKGYIKIHEDDSTYFPTTYDSTTNFEEDGELLIG